MLQARPSYLLSQARSRLLLQKGRLLKLRCALRARGEAEEEQALPWSRRGPAPLVDRKQCFNTKTPCELSQSPGCL